MSVKTMSDVGRFVIGCLGLILFCEAALAQQILSPAERAAEIRRLEWDRVNLLAKAADRAEAAAKAANSAARNATQAAEAARKAAQAARKAFRKNYESSLKGARVLSVGKPLPVAPNRRLRVGSGMPFRLPSQAAEVARDGDIVEIASGNYVDCAIWRANKLTIRGVGGRAHVKDKTCAGKAIWITVGDDITIENIEFSGMRVRDRNGAGIRHEGRGLTIRNAYFHDGEEGILSGNRRPGDKILIEYSEFARLGKGGRAHSIYIGRAASFTLRNSFVHDCIGEGNCVKSRAFETEITCNRIASLDGNSSWEIDLPEGGFAMVRRNVIEQGRHSVNWGIIGFAMETSAKRGHPNQVLVLTDNILINDLGRGHFVLVKRRPDTSVLIKRNVFVGGGRRPDDRENSFYKSRRSAGLPPYPELPKPCQ